MGAHAPGAGRFWQLQPAGRRFRRNGLLSDLATRYRAAVDQRCAVVKTWWLAAQILAPRSSMVKQLTLTWTTRMFGRASHTVWYNTSLPSSPAF